jgi:Flp pilus assembly protein TadG
MKKNVLKNLRKLTRSENGYTAIFMAGIIFAFTAIAGLSIDVSRTFMAYQQLVASTNAATLAAAQVMPNQTSASLEVTAYSAQSGQKNASPLLTSVQATPTYNCLTYVSSTLVTPCETSSGGSGTGAANAVLVNQTAKVPLLFGAMFGINTFSINYSAEAAMRGGSTGPWNIAIIDDATASMGNSDGGTQCSGTRENCALVGIQDLLKDLYPCALNVTCSSTTTYVDDVSIFAFPPLTTATIADDYCSGGASPSSVAHGYYVVPTLSSTYTYQVFSFSNNYKTTDTASTLYTSSNAVKATGYTGTSCAGIYPKGGAGTYYAQVIYAAQAALVTQQAGNPGSRNAMIILTDGDANAGVTYTSSQDTAISSTSQLQPSATNSLNGVAYHNPTTATYPSAVGQCGQAVLAAQAATQAGTRVYTIAYGSPISGSCTTDATYTSTGNTSYGGGAWPATAHGSDNGKQACDAIAAMASATSDFFSDDYNGCAATYPSNAALKTLTAIFQQVANTMTMPRLIPISTQ